MLIIISRLWVSAVNEQSPISSMIVLDNFFFVYVLPKSQLPFHRTFSLIPNLFPVTRYSCYITWLYIQSSWSHISQWSDSRNQVFLTWIAFLTKNPFLALDCSIAHSLANSPESTTSLYYQLLQRLLLTQLQVWGSESVYHLLQKRPSQRLKGNSFFSLTTYLSP